MPEGIPPDIIRNIAHELANSLNSVSSTVQLLEADLKERQGDVEDLNAELITILKDECSRMKINIAELQQLGKEPS